jgi:hypothetical protein
LKPAPPALNFSTAVEADGHCAVLNDHGYFAPAVAIAEHPGEPSFVFEHVDVFERNLAAGEILTGSRRVGSEILAKN